LEEDMKDSETKFEITRVSWNEDTTIHERKSRLYGRAIQTIYWRG
jgi:hypothetical protein